MGWFRRKTDDEIYAERIYRALVDRELGGMTPEKLRIPTNMHARYREKALHYREICALAAIATLAQDTRLRGVMGALVSLVQAKRARRGLGSASRDEAMYSAIDSVEDLFTDPFKWAQRWLMEFRNDPDDNFMVVLFADHWQRHWNAVKHALETTLPK
jgi:hypothetical protein